MTLFTCLFAAASVVSADVVTLSNGKKLKGLVVEEGEAGVNLQVDEEGYVELEKAMVGSVKRDSSAANDRIKAGWAADRRKAEAAEDKERRFAESQRAKGLAFYEGEWLTPKEAEIRLKRRETDDAAHGKNAQAFVAREAQPVQGAPQSTYSTMLAYVPFAAVPEKRKARRRPVIIFQDGKVVFSSEKKD